MSAVRFSNVTRRFGSVRAVDDVSLEIGTGEFFAMLGPSGSGKTTCLRLIAGFEQPDSGQIDIAGQNVVEVPPYRRHVNTVFQDYALFPHLTVGENVAFGLMIKGVNRASREAAAKAALAMVKLAGFESRTTKQMSGGQRQRVALARALVNKPKVLLLDEPLGALDLKLREQMQDELQALQRSLGITFVFVTHDQSEALSMANRVAIFNEGRIIQVGAPEDVYERPNSPFVANFVGSSNVLPPGLASMMGCGPRWISLRPEKISIAASGATFPETHIQVEGAVDGVTYQGSVVRYHVVCSGESITVVENSGGQRFARGDMAKIGWPKTAMVEMKDAP